MHERGSLFICVWLQGRAEIVLITKAKVFSYFHNTVDVKQCAWDIFIIKYVKVWLWTPPPQKKARWKQLGSEKTPGCLLSLLSIIYLHTSAVQWQPQQLPPLKHQLGIYFLFTWAAWHQRWAVARGDSELWLMTLVFNNRRAVISGAALCNRLSDKRGAGGFGWCR